MELTNAIHSAPDIDEPHPAHKVLRLPDMDLRVRKLIGFTDSNDGRLCYRVEAACRELKLDISARHAARLFKQCAGLGFMQYAKGRRLMMGAKWLATTELSVKAIAAELGYKESSDFGRAFKTYFGLSPRMFRQRLCASNAQLVS